MDFSELIILGDFIPYNIINDNYVNYLWDDWDKCNELILKNDKLYIYTVIHEDGKLWINEGMWLFNRVGYLFSRKYVKLNESIEY